MLSPMQTIRQHLQTGGPWLIFIAAMLWATDAPFRYHLTQSLSSGFIVLAEHAVNVLLVLPFIFRNWNEIRSLNWKQWLSMLAIGIGASALASILFTQAFSYVNPSVAIVLQKLQPLIVIGLAATFLKERTGRRFWLFAAVALFAAYIISFPNLRPELFTGEVWNPKTLGVLCALGAAVLWGLGTVLGRVMLAQISFKTVTSLRFLIAFIFLLFWNLHEATIATVEALTGKDILFIIIVAVTSGFTSLFIYYKGLERTRASVATFAELGFPFLSVLVNALALGVFLKPIQLVGMALLVFAVAKLSRIDQSTQKITAP